jgi:gliding motility-associated-like protein
MVNIGPDLSLCSYDSATLDAGAGYRSYRWSTGQTDRLVQVRTTGNYWIRTEDAYGCISQDTLRVDVYAAPAVNLGQDRNLCTGETLVLDPGAFSQYSWQDGSTGRTLAVRQPGLYAVTVTNNRGCRGSDSFQVNTLLPMPADFLKPSVSFCKYQDIELVPNRDFSAYRWSTGSRQRTVRVNRGGAYTLEVEDANGCKGKDTIQVIENDCLNGVFIPNAFTPNGDQLNDRFMALVYGKVVSFRLQVYNRFGELVFSTTDPRQGWDGIFKGKDSPAGNFVWQCSYQLEGSEPAYQKGTVMLIR